MSAAPRPRPLTSCDLAAALADGWHVLRRCPRFSLGYGALFTVAGGLLIWAAQAFGVAPMAPALAGGFLLVGPAATAGLVGTARRLRRGEAPSMGRLLSTLYGAPRGLWALALFCVLIYFIWITDAGTLYSIMIGEARSGLDQALPLAPDTARFQLFSAATGLVLASVVFAVSVHTVPLMVRCHTPLVGAIIASVRALATSPLSHAAWALTLAAGVAVSLLFPPLLCASLPLLAYAGDALSESCFPDCMGAH